jgi:hypothetical protein
VPVPEYVCEPEASSSSNFARSDQVGLIFNSASTDVSAEFAGAGGKAALSPDGHEGHEVMQVAALHL